MNWMFAHFPLKKLIHSIFQISHLEVGGCICTFVSMIFCTLPACIAFLFSISDYGNVPEKGKEKIETHLWATSRVDWKIYLKSGRQEMDGACAPQVELTYTWPPGLCSYGNLALFLLSVESLVLSIQEKKVRLKSFTWNYQILVSTIYLPWDPLACEGCGHIGIQGLFSYLASIIHFCILSIQSSS